MLWEKVSDYLYEDSVDVVFYLRCIVRNLLLFMYNIKIE